MQHGQFSGGDFSIKTEKWLDMYLGIDTGDKEKDKAKLIWEEFGSMLNKTG